MKSLSQLRHAIVDLTRAFGEASASQEMEFKPGVSPVPVSGKVLDAADYVALVDASLDGWLTSGRFHTEFQQRLAKFVGVRNSVFVNSGSSANLAALSALTSPKLGKKALQPGDEVLTVAAGFPTTVNPIIQNGLRPVLVDIELGTYDAISERLRDAVTPKTKAIMMAHCLGNPFDLDTVMDLKEKHGLFLVEDSCDALGATYRGKKTGSFGDTATVSFYPA
ncbi:aminotransferase class I/II-fold pyridoxal phosphate-dependent enzyme, partial [Pontimonas sp.]|nr:aminotransferase class I/II-fold pyridoxal phosphate-dependent enzyme [Pontimonas sp.]